VLIVAAQARLMVDPVLVDEMLEVKLERLQERLHSMVKQSQAESAANKSA
jgi:hypothetical protein